MALPPTKKEGRMYVNYRVDGPDGTPHYFQSGPYSPDEVEWHCRDIAGYEGITHAYVSPYREEDRTLISAKAP
jgi:hypothetical protein